MTINPSQPPILFPKAQVSRKKRVGKRAYQKKLEEDNEQLKNMIKQLMQDISAKEAQNTVLSQQLQFFMNQISNVSGETAPDSTESPTKNDVDNDNFV